MSAEEIITTTARLSRRLAIEISLTRSGRMDVVWNPRIPARLSKKEHRAYLKARHEAVSKLSELMGGAVVMVTL